VALVLVCKIRSQGRARNIVQPIAPSGGVNIRKFCFYVLRIAGPILPVKASLLGLGIEQQEIGCHAESDGLFIRLTSSCFSLPDNFIPELLWPEDCIHQHLQIMACGRIAV
jgi:hypothetical protein